MADNKKQSADEIVDNLAEEMGVKNEKVPSDDLASDLGGIFGVSSKKKKKKVEEPEPVSVAKKEAPAQDEVEEPETPPADEGDTEEAQEEDEVVAPPKKEVAKKSPDKPATKKAEKSAPAATKKSEPEPAKKKGAAAIDGVFATGSSKDTGDDYGASSSRSAYLDEDDLGGATPAGGANKALIGVIAALVVALIGVVLMVTPLGKDILLVFKGEYNAQKDAEIARQEEEFNQAQKDALPKFGNLLITGNPLYSTIKLNGEVQYGQTSSGLWREVTLKPGFSNFGNLPVKEKQMIEVSSPGFDTATFELTEGKWQGTADGPRSFNYVASLLPSSEWQKAEYDARMSSDVDNEYFGTITITSAPAGASILFNNNPLLDAKGNELKTPATFTSAYVKDEKGKLEEVPVKVDTTIDLGHKLEVFFPDKADMPRYGTQIERQMWVCTKKDEAELKRLPKDHSVQQECDYTFTKNVDFEGIKAYAARREEEKKRIEEYNAKIKELRAKAMEANGQLTEEEIEQMRKVAN